MADLNELVNKAAEELLEAISDQAPKASDSKLLNLARAFSLVVSAEVAVELVEEDETWEADDEPGQSPQEPMSPEAKARFVFHDVIV